MSRCPNCGIDPNEVERAVNLAVQTQLSIRRELEQHHFTMPQVTEQPERSMPEVRSW